MAPIRISSTAPPRLPRGEIAAIVLAVVLGTDCFTRAPVPTQPAAEAAVAAPPEPVVAAEVSALDAGVEASDASAPPVVLAPPAPAPAPEDMLLVKGGTFRMGADEGGEGDERPAHDVTLASFWLDKTEVSQTAYDACVAAGACTPADPEILATFSVGGVQGPFKGPQRPVVGISWFSAREYCKWRGKRLPREAEFERAARGEDGRRFPWGNEPPTKERAVFSPSNYPEDVGTHPSGRGPYGHDDLAGNVWEWIEDDYDPLAYNRPTAGEGKAGTCEEILAAQNKLRSEGKQGFTGTNPIPTECEKAIRGGAYNYGGPGLRSTNRVHHPPRFKLRMTGARCAKDA